MTEPIVPEGNSGPFFESDRNLLLHEIRSLGGEVARLRGDTKHLNEVIVPREEHARRRRVNSILAGLSLLLFAVAMTAVYVVSSRVAQTNRELAATAYEACLARESREQASAEGAVEINALLATLRDTESQLLAEGDPALVKIRDARVRAYNRYLAYVDQQQDEAAALPEPPPCSSYRLP